MALIICPECGKSVSDKATVCPECGYPLAGKGYSGELTPQNAEFAAVKASNAKKTIIIILSAIAVLLAVLAVILALRPIRVRSAARDKISSRKYSEAIEMLNGLKRTEEVEELLKDAYEGLIEETIDDGDYDKAQRLLNEH